MKKALEAIGEVVEAAIQAIGEVVAEIGEAFEAIGKAFEDLGKAIAELGRVIEELAELVGAEILAFFGDDRAKRALEQAKRAKEAEVRAKRAREAAEHARLAKLQQDRELLIVDLAENMSDAAVIDGATATAVQGQINTSIRPREPLHPTRRGRPARQ